MKIFLQIALCSFLCLNICSVISAASLANKTGGQTEAPLPNSPCSSNVQRKCQCGRHLRNLTSTRNIAGKTYDTLVPLGDGLDGKVEHAFSQSLGRCVAVKKCLEDPTRLSKCTRELKVLQRMNGVAPHIVPLEDFEIKCGQPCTEGAVMSDFIRTVIIGTEKRRRRRRRRDADEEKAAEDIDTLNSSSTSIGNNCNEVTLVEELGADEVEHYLRETKTKGQRRRALPLEQITAMIRKAMDELHENGIAHRDMHKDNAMLFPVPPLVNHSDRCDQTVADKWPTKLTVKVIDLGWACCFDPKKCGASVSAAVPNCEAKKALNDDQFSLQDVISELEEL